MKRLLILILCLSLLTGCMALPAFSRREGAIQAVTAAPTEAPATPVSAIVSAPPSLTTEPLPQATAAPVSTAAPTATPVPLQAYVGGRFQFDVPGGWLRANLADGVCFYPDPGDIQRTALFYQEMANELKLTETSVDIALLFAGKETVTALVEKALTDSGFTGFTLSPVDISKTKLNGLTCYAGASRMDMDGETFDFTGHVFLRGDRIILLVWVGDEARYTDELGAVYDSFREK